MENLIRQGDILLVPLDEMPKRLEGRRRERRVSFPKGEGVIVAQGEATGHHHRIRTKSVVLYRDGAATYIKVPKGGAELSHEEHHTLTVPEGWYRMDNQREYQPQSAPRRVYD